MTYIVLKALLNSNQPTFCVKWDVKLNKSVDDWES